MGIKTSSAQDRGDKPGRRHFVRYLITAGAIAGSFLTGRFSSTAGETLRADESVARTTAAKTTTTIAATTSPISTYPNRDFSVKVQSGTNWNWGGWVDIIPSGSIKPDFLIVGIHLWTNDIDGAIELGAGSKGSEAILAHLPSSGSAGFQGFKMIIFFPSALRVKAGSRVALRYTVGTSTPVSIRIKVLYQEVLSG